MPDPNIDSRTGLDRESYLQVFVPGVVLLAGIGVAAFLFPGFPRWIAGLWGNLRGIPAEALVAGLFVFVGGGSLALVLGYLNLWLGRHLFGRSPFRSAGLSMLRQAEILPYWALWPDFARPNRFYSELRECTERCISRPTDLNVTLSNGMAKRDGHDVAADLMEALIRASGGDASAPVLDLVRAYNEKSDVTVAMSTSLSLSLLLIACSSGVRIAVSHGPRALLVLIPVALAVIAFLLYRWLTYKAVDEWVNGRNALGRGFWALYRSQMAPPARAHRGLHRMVSMGPRIRRSGRKVTQ